MQAELDVQEKKTKASEQMGRHRLIDAYVFFAFFFWINFKEPCFSDDLNCKKLTY